MISFEHIIHRTFHILLVLLFFLSACSDSKNTPKVDTTKDYSPKEIALSSKAEIAKTPEESTLQKALSYDKSGVIQVPDGCFELKKGEEKFSCLYERFNYESVLCSKLDKLLTDKGINTILKKDFYSSTGGVEQLTMFLNRQLREDSNVRYLVTHPAYFEIDIDFHYSPLGAVYLAETDMYCAQTMKRLHELESLGRSDIVWRAREKWLNHHFASIDMPWDEMASVSPESFFNEFEKVKQLYNSPEDKKNLRRWVDNAEKILFQKAEKGEMEGAGGQTKEQHLATLRQWVKQMRHGL